MSDAHRDIIKLELVEPHIIRRSPEVEHERAIAIYDLLEENIFRPHDMDSGPYHLKISIEDDRLIFDIHDTKDQPLGEIILPARPFKRIVRDYFMICDSYYAAIRQSSLQQIEALDMGRRGIHDEGAEMLQERLSQDAVIDQDTARRLFTLVCVLHIRG